MLVHATPRQAAAIVRAMKCVATGDGADTPTVAAVAPTALEDLQRRFRIPALAPVDAATDDRPQGFKPIE